MKFLLSLLASCFALDTSLLMMMMQQQGSNPSQQGQMDMMLPLLLMEDADNKTSDNSDMLMMMMMQGQNMNDMGSILPLMLLGDQSLDFKSLFLMTNMMNQDCSQDTDQQMNMLIPMLLSGKYYLHWIFFAIITII